MKTIPVLLLLILVTACDRKKEDAILAKGASFRLIRTDYYGLPANPSSVRSTRYEYDPNNLIREVLTGDPTLQFASRMVYRWVSGYTLRIEEYFNNPPWSSYVNTVQTGSLNIFSYSETVYNSDTTIRERKNYTIWEDKADYRSYTTYEYNAQKRVTRRNTYKVDGKLASYTLFEYDNRENVTKETLFSNVSNTTEPNIITTYEYDNAPNPYRTARLNSEISWYMSTNNIIRQKSINLASAINSDEQWTYEYRPDGFPARQIYADGRKKEFIYSN